MSCHVKVSGLVELLPANPHNPDGFTATVDPSGERETFAAQVAGRSDVDATDAAPSALDLGGVAAVRLVLVRSVASAPMVALVTSARGTDQRVPFDDVLVAHASAGDPIVAISIVGVGPIEHVVAGDSPAAPSPPAPVRSGRFGTPTIASLRATDANVYQPDGTTFFVTENGATYALVAATGGPDDGVTTVDSNVPSLQWVAVSP